MIRSEQGTRPGSFRNSGKVSVIAKSSSAAAAYVVECGTEMVVIDLAVRGAGGDGGAVAAAAAVVAGDGRSCCRTEEWLLLLLIGQHSMDWRLHYVIRRDIMVRRDGQTSSLHVDPGGRDREEREGEKI